MGQFGGFPSLFLPHNLQRRRDARCCTTILREAVGREEKEFLEGKGEGKKREKLCPLVLYERFFKESRTSNSKLGNANTKG